MLCFAIHHPGGATCRLPRPWVIPKAVLISLSLVSGGIGEAVCGAVSEEPGITVRRLAVPRVPRSGPPDVLIDMFGISARHIIAAVKNFWVAGITRNWAPHSSSKEVVELYFVAQFD